MNNLNTNTRFFLLLILLNAGTSFRLPAQEFIQKYPFFTWVIGGPQSVFPQPDGGFRLTAIEYPDFGFQIGLYWLNTDAQGVLQQTQTHYIPFTNQAYGTDLFLLESGNYAYAAPFNETLTLEVSAPNGDLIWSYSYGPPLPNIKAVEIITVAGNSNEELFVRGIARYMSSTQPDEGFILKFSADGQLLWDRFYDFENSLEIPTSLLPTPDGGCMFNNQGTPAPPSILPTENLLHYDGNGNQLWTYSPAFPNRLYPHFSDKVFDVNSQSQTFLFAKPVNNPSGYNPLLLQKLDATGNVQTDIDLNVLLNRNNLAKGKLLFATADGGAVVVVEEYLLNSWAYTVARVDANHMLLWQIPVDSLYDSMPADFADGKELSDGSLVLYAYQSGHLFLYKLNGSQPSATFEPDALLQLQIQPNPARTHTTVQLDALGGSGRRLILRDVSGRVVREWPAESPLAEIQRAGEPAGLYWLELQEAGQPLAVGKLIWNAH